MFLFIVAVLTVLILIFLLPTNQDLIHTYVLVGVRVSVSKSDGDDVVSLDFPLASDKNIASCLQSAPLSTYHLL